MKNNRQKGAVALILVVLVLSALMAISLGISGLVIQQIRLARQVGESAGAYQAADSGIEMSLYHYNTDEATTTVDFLSVANGLNDSANYCSGADTYWFNVGPNAFFCLELNEDEGKITSIKSIGKQKETRRAAQISVSSP